MAGPLQLERDPPGEPRRRATRKVFWEDPYQTELETEIQDVRGASVTLKDTIFFAFSGGQESDQGTIGGHAVLEARKDGPDIVYTLPAEHGLDPGQVVRVEIDWPRRYSLMRLHFAAELVLELVYRLRPGVEKIGAHIGEEKARIDFVWTGSIGGELAGIAQRVAAIVAADLPITSAYSDPIGQRRYWQIESFARVPCGGTHLRTTREVGAIELRRKNIGRDKERIEITLSHPG
jgi:Ser-tRNA(Ala) deacylase AlaX